MKDGLLDRITGVGHWRVVVRPLIPVEQKLSFENCKQYVMRRRVSLRGWDFPHVNERNDQFGGSGNFDDYFENWVDWQAHWEFLRMYRSGQFISYTSLYEDAVAQLERNSTTKSIDAIGALYSMTEFVEFSVRLMHEVEYKPGVQLSVSLRNTKDRRLSTSGNRMPFYIPKITQASKIELNSKIIGETNSGLTMPISYKMAKEFFDYFGWNADDDLINSEINRFLNRQV